MKSFEEIVDEVTAELFGTDNFARILKPYVEGAIREHPGWENWPMTDQKLYLSDDIDFAFILLQKQKSSDSVQTD